MRNCICGGARLRRALIHSERNQASTESRPTWFIGREHLPKSDVNRGHEPWPSGVSAERRWLLFPRIAALCRDAAKERRFMERFPRKISRIKPLNRSRRRESALILCLENKQMRRLTSAATRFMERRNLQNLDAHRGHEPD